MSNPRAVLRELFDVAVEAAQPAHCIPGALEQIPGLEDALQAARRIHVVGAGKASAEMAAALERALADQAPALRERLSGVVVTRYGYAVPCESVEILEASHPVPDDAGVAATRRILETVRDAGPEDVVLALISGGGSALLAAPIDGVTLADKRSVTDALLRSGAPIHHMNAVRRALSAVKGGGLAEAAGATRLIGLLISDVPGDDPAVIASGPTVPGPVEPARALALLEAYGIAPPPTVTAALEAASGRENGVRGDGARVENHVIASAHESLQAAARHARTLGYTPCVLGDALEGESRDVAQVHAAIAQYAQKQGQPVAVPAVVLSGGETTVTVRGDGRGGRNAEFVLAMACALKEADGIHALAGDTDGIDGTEENAGAVIGPDTLQRARDAGEDPHARLAANDAYTLFAATDELLVTGPSGTNVNDFRAVLIDTLG